MALECALCVARAATRCLVKVRTLCDVWFPSYVYLKFLKMAAKFSKIHCSFPICPTSSGKNYPPQFSELFNNAAATLPIFFRKSDSIFETTASKA